MEASTQHPNGALAIRSAVLVDRVFQPSGLKAGTEPEIALIGRSNVGKSSVLNSLVRKRLAATGKQPGRTHGLFFYRVNESMVWVDFPGYGYAKRPKLVREAWRIIADHYLRTRRVLRGVFLLLDARHEPTRLDVQMAEWLKYYRKPTVVLLTKVDKLNRSEWARCLRTMESWCRGYHVLDVLGFSSITGLGRKAVLRWVNQFCYGEDEP